MDIKRSNEDIENLLAISWSSIRLALRYNEEDNVKAILLNLYKEGYRDGCIATLLEQKNKEKE